MALRDYSQLATRRFQLGAARHDVHRRVELRYRLRIEVLPAMSKAPLRLLMALFLLAPLLASAAPALTVTAAWARATPPGVTTAAA